MAEFKPGDHVLVAGWLHDVNDGAFLVSFGHGLNNNGQLISRDVRPYTDPGAANPLDAAVAELGRVTGLRGDDLLTAAKRAILGAAWCVRDAGIDLRAARDEAMDGIRRAIGDAPLSVLEHAAALPSDDDTDDTPF